LEKAFLIKKIECLQALLRDWIENGLIYEADEVFLYSGVQMDC
jgi:hypothetical protein